MDTCHVKENIIAVQRFRVFRFRIWDFRFRIESEINPFKNHKSAITNPKCINLDPIRFFLDLDRRETYC